MAKFGDVASYVSTMHSCFCSVLLQLEPAPASLGLDLGALLEKIDDDLAFTLLRDHEGKTIHRMIPAHGLCLEAHRFAAYNRQLDGNDLSHRQFRFFQDGPKAVLVVVHAGADRPPVVGGGGGALAAITGPGFRGRRVKWYSPRQ